MDLFDIAMEKNLDRMAPLADRMRPTSLSEFVGQNHIIGKGKFLQRAIQSDKLPSMIFYGPPGTGKTTLAKVIANTTSMEFRKLNAVTSGIKDIRKIIKQAEERLKVQNRRTILFIDEIHRFNKAQQDALLPVVEKGIIILIGATTENPYFEVNKALLSRARVIELNPLSDENIRQLLFRALKDKEKGMGKFDVKIDSEAINYIMNISQGDGRIALNSLELGILTTPRGKDGIINIDIGAIKNCIQKNWISYDKDGDEHYDTISAFIKSMRGSDPDATLYWLAKMIEAGEDPKFIARRIIISAAEEVGNADPNALSVAVNAFKAVEIIGMPEGRIPLAQAAVYIACAPKSNASYIGIKKALEDIKNDKIGKVPSHLNNKAYKNPHDYPKSYIQQQYLPDGKINSKYYQPTMNGYERVINKRLNNLFDKNG